MPARKTPQPEEARTLFLQYPDKKLSDWADEWGITKERVRQIRHEAGVGAVYKVDLDIVNLVCDEIIKGNHTLASKDLYKDLPIGYEAFKTWMLKNDDVKELVQNAQNIAASNKVNPINKTCVACKEIKEVSKFNKSQKFIDGRAKICIDCSDIVTTKSKTKRKICMSCKKEKSSKSFTSNKKFKDGLVPFCKTCKSKMRRAKRTLNTKVTDSI